MTTEEQIRQIAADTLDVKSKMDVLNRELDAKKELLRQFANGDNFEIVVEGKGKIRVSKPREAKEEEILVVNETKLNEVPDLKDKLIQKGVIKKEIKKSSAAKASVIVEANV
jgi:hypothetical protein